mgnify:CR=1 FL=1
MRRFDLNIEDCKTDKEKRYYKKALKAYMNGHVNFRFGFTTVKGQRVPAWYVTPIKNKYRKNKLEPNRCPFSLHNVWVLFRNHIFLNTPT